MSRLSRLVWIVTLLAVMSVFTASAVSASPNYRPIIENPMVQAEAGEPGMLVAKWCVSIYDPNGEAVKVSYRSTHSEGSIVRRARQGRVRCVWHQLPASVLEAIRPNQQYLYTIVVTATDSRGLKARFPLRERIARITIGS